MTFEKTTFKQVKTWWWIGALAVVGSCGGTAGNVVGNVATTTSQVAHSAAVESIRVEPRTTPAEAATTTTSPDDLAVAFDRLMQARIECGRHPYTCDVASFAEVGSPIYNDLTELIDTRRRAHITATGGGAIRYRIDQTQSLSETSALVHTCINDDVVLVDGDIIFDDSSMSSLVTFELTKVDERWLWSKGTPTRWTTEEDLCDFDA